MLTEQIHAIREWSGGTYAAPRIHAELKGCGVRVGCKRVARLWLTTRDSESGNPPKVDYFS